jgi:hypothetical protein
MHGSLVTLQNYPLYFKGQLRVLPKEDVKKLQNAFSTNKRLGFGKVKFSIRAEQISHLFCIAMIKHFEKFME